MQDRRSCDDWRRRIHLERFGHPQERNVGVCHPQTHSVKTFNFLMVTGESSGDMYGAEVARSLFQRFPGCTIFGVGGQRMRDAGVKMEGDIRDTAVMGPLGALFRLPVFYRLFHRLADRVEADPPTAAILIDFSGF